ncbi:hypothetical protein GBS0709_16540 [Edwardsiella tarda]|nr:hypothetical protein GBS0709_16540 [Edwardsiella tarda]
MFRPRRTRYNMDHSPFRQRLMYSLPHIRRRHITPGNANLVIPSLQLTPHLWQLNTQRSYPLGGCPHMQFETLAKSLEIPVKADPNQSLCRQIECVRRFHESLYLSRLLN